eukprot:scaffold598_cov318-Pavlova_lutheri.AAC.4
MQQCVGGELSQGLRSTKQIKSRACAIPDVWRLSLRQRMQAQIHTSRHESGCARSGIGGTPDHAIAHGFVAAP